MSGRVRNIPRGDDSPISLMGIFLAFSDIEESEGPSVRLGGITSTLVGWSAIPLRVIVGYGFFAHGYAKVMNGPDHFAASLHALGVPASHLMAWTTIGFELLGGLAIVIGAWIPLVSVPLAVILLVAAITVHLPYGFSSITLRSVTAAGPQFGPPGYETNLLYLAALVTLAVGGPGPLALDTLLARHDGTPGRKDA
jgi:putative oxidoreductase